MSCMSRDDVSADELGPFRAHLRLRRGRLLLHDSGVKGTAMKCWACGHEGTLWYVGGDWLCWRCHWPGLKEMVLAAWDEVTFFVGNLGRKEAL